LIAPPYATRRTTGQARGGRGQQVDALRVHGEGRGLRGPLARVVLRQRERVLGLLRRDAHLRDARGVDREQRAVEEVQRSGLSRGEELGTDHEHRRVGDVELRVAVEAVGRRVADDHGLGGGGLRGLARLLLRERDLHGEERLVEAELRGVRGRERLVAHRGEVRERRELLEVRPRHGRGEGCRQLPVVAVLRQREALLRVVAGAHDFERHHAVERHAVHPQG
jgi:hypothetical protein